MLGPLGARPRRWRFWGSPGRRRPAPHRGSLARSGRRRSRAPVWPGTRRRGWASPPAGASPGWAGAAVTRPPALQRHRAPGAAGAGAERRRGPAPAHGAAELGGGSAGPLPLEGAALSVVKRPAPGLMCCGLAGDTPFQRRSGGPRSGRGALSLPGGKATSEKRAPVSAAGGSVRAWQATAEANGARCLFSCRGAPPGGFPQRSEALAWLEVARSGAVPTGMDAKPPPAWSWVGNRAGGGRSEPG